jgi:hypothetical protein
VPVRIVAAGHDTSVAMIERNYSRYITDHADALVRGAMLDLVARDKRSGADMPVPEWCERLVCSQCGSRDIDMVLTGQRR